MRKLSLLVRVPVAAAMVVVLGLVLLTALTVTSPIFELVGHVDGPGTVTPDSIKFGVGITMFGTVGLLSVPAALALTYLTGSDTDDRQPRRGRRF